MKGFFLILFIVSFILSCHERVHKHLHPLDKWSDWLLKNEEKMNVELNKKMILQIAEVPKNAIFKSATIVVTRHDTTILGEFAKLFNDYCPCLLISYTFMRDTSNRKIISLFRDQSTPCKVNTDTLLIIDSTRFFIIKKTSQ